MTILERRDGVILDSDLYRLLEQDFGEVNKQGIVRALMDLEIGGKIHVQHIKKNTFRISQLAEDAAKYLAVGED